MEFKSLYIQVYGKLPRKRKAQRFERMVRKDVHSGQSLLDYKEQCTGMAHDLMSELKLRDVTNINAALWNCHEMPFTNQDGTQDAIVMRAVFPCSESINLMEA